MITFTKILEYKLRPENTNTYEYISQVTTQTIDPPTLRKGELVPAAKTILHSPLKRAVECIQKLSSHVYISMDELKEIPFDLKKMANENEWNIQGSVIVRNKFKEMFLNDTLLISRDQIFREIKTVLEKCVEYKHVDVAVVTHSFRMKLIEAFIDTKGAIEKKPELIHGFIKSDQKTYAFGEGFEVESLLS